VLKADFCEGFNFTSMTHISYSFLDLFAGCGGLSEGFYLEGFTPLAHLELDSRACETLRKQMARHGYHDADSAVIQGDITNTATLTKLKRTISRRTVDVIVGGPPCQSFSKLGRVRDPDGMQNDPRNYLFEHYVKILNTYRPKVFVFENVTGILTQIVKDTKIISIVLCELGKHYKLLHDPESMLLDAVHYGVPQERTRLFIIGVRRDITIEPDEIYAGINKTHYGRWDSESDSLKKFVSVREAIGDLPHLHPGDGVSPMPYQPNSLSKYPVYATCFSRGNLE
jgi:DNA (cytosine-5)-methyltransferase 1